MTQLCARPTGGAVEGVGGLRTRGVVVGVGGLRGVVVGVVVVEEGAGVEEGGLRTRGVEEGVEEGVVVVGVVSATEEGVVEEEGAGTVELRFMDRYFCSARARLSRDSIVVCIRICPGVIPLDAKSKSVGLACAIDCGSTSHTNSSDISSSDANRSDTLLSVSSSDATSCSTISSPTSSVCTVCIWCVVLSLGAPFFISDNKRKIRMGSSVPRHVWVVAHAVVKETHKAAQCVRILYRVERGPHVLVVFHVPSSVDRPVSEEELVPS